MATEISCTPSGLGSDAAPGVCVVYMDLNCVPLLKSLFSPCFALSKILCLLLRPIPFALAIIMEFSAYSGPVGRRLR